MNILRRNQKDVALLWDESFLWGVMACEAITGAGLPFRLVSAADVGNGALADFGALFVPGGWASNKLEALGEAGAARVREFVENGGAYIGFCGGAGLATRDGLGLINVKRVPTAQRVPSFSGRVRLTLERHALWEGIDDPVFHVWWPSQLAAGEDVTVLARYDQALPDAFSSDLNVGDVAAGGGWAEWEQSYGINLDPSRMAGLPAVVTGSCGQGRVFLSLVHFDTPGDGNGGGVLQNLWTLLTGGRSSQRPGHKKVTAGATPSPGDPSPALRDSMNGLGEAVDGLIDFGMRNFLWFGRQPSMLQWKRGVRGLEYYTLKVMMDEIRGLLLGIDRPFAPRAEKVAVHPDIASAAAERLQDISTSLLSFVAEAKTLLLLERQAMMAERLTFAESTDSRILALRQRLFSTKKSHGGLFKDLIDQMSKVLYSLITQTDV